MTLAMNHLAIDEETKQRISINYAAANIAATLLEETKNNEDIEPVQSAVITKFKYNANDHKDQESYDWKLSNDTDSKDNDIKQTKPGTHIKPMYFTVDRLSFSCYFYPNGKTSETENQIDWVLQLLSLSPSLSSVTIEFRVVLMSTKDCYSANITFAHNNLKIYFNDFIPKQDIINSKDLAFKIFIKTLETRNQKNELVDSEYSDNISALNLSYLPSAAMTWSTKDEKTMNGMKRYGVGNYKTTNIFAVKQFKFLMKIYSNGTNDKNAGKFCLELSLITLPPKLSGFSVVLNAQLVSNNVTYDSVNYANFTQLNASAMSIICCDGFCSFEEFGNMSEFTLNVHILFVDVFALKNGDSYSVIDEYNNSDNDCKALVLPTKYYKWSPPNTESVLNAENTKYFNSDIFQLESFKFMLQIYPNGYTPSHKGKFAAFLYLASLAPQISKIVALIRLRIYFKSDLSHSFLDTGEYSANNTKLGWITTGIDDIEYLSGITELKFEVTVLIIDVFNHKGESMDSYGALKSPLKDTSLLSRTWKIHNKDALEMVAKAENGESFESGFFKLHNLNWNIKMYPNGKRELGFEDGDVLLQIQCEELIKPINAVSFMYTFWIEETQTWFSDIAHFRNSKDNYNGLRSNWTLSHLKLDQIKGLEKLTIKLEVRLLELYAEHNMLMTHNI